MSDLIPADDEAREAAEAAEAEAKAKAEKRKKQFLLGGALGGILLLSGVGTVLWLTSGSDAPKPMNQPYSNLTLADKAQGGENGAIAINPQQIMLAQQGDGTWKGTVTVSALFQDFTVGNVEVIGNPDLALSSRCPAASQILKMGQQCEIDVLWRGSAKPAPPAGTAAAAATAGLPGQQAADPAATASAAPTAPQIALHITGTSRSTNGATVPIEQYAPVSGFPGAATGIGGAIDPATGAAVAANGQPLPGGAAAGAGIDPYGPANPNLAGTGAAGAAGGPLQPGSAGGYAGAGGSAASGPPPLSLREQYILARRQSAFSGAQPRYAPAQPAQAPGSWEGIKVPSVTSSAQQDMTRVLTMDRVITAVLVRTFDNRSSQQVIAQVDRNVYGAMGRTILIPRGSMLIGTMSSGAERSVVNWTQIIRPDGARFVMKASGGDAMGQSGVPGYTNNRFMKRFGAILLGTLLKSGVAAATNATQTQSATGSVNGTATTEQNTGAVVTGIVSQDLNQIVQQIIAQNQKIMPVTVVPAGTRLTVFPQQDLVLYAVQRETITRPAYPRPMNGGAGSVSFSPGGEEGGVAEKAAAAIPGN